MSKFKIGDRVKIIDTTGDGAARGRLGAVGVVKSVKRDSLTEVSLEPDGAEVAMYARRFAPVTPAFTLQPGKFYHTASGAVTGRVSKGDTGFEAVVDGHVRIFDSAGGAVHGGDDIVEEWAPKVGERVRFTIDNPNGGKHYGEAGEIVEVVRSREKNLHYGDQVAIALHTFDWHPSAPISALEPLPVAAPAQPATVEPAMFQIGAGRYYKTRDGRKVGPMEPAKFSDGWYDAATRVTSQRWEKDGRFIPGEVSLLDLVAEWVDEPALAPALVAAQVDAIAEEYGPVVGNDNKPDTTLHLKFASDFSELDAAIVVRKKKLKKLIKLARKAGIYLREDEEDEQVKLKVGDLVVLNRSAMITGFNKHSVSIQTDGGNYSLPLIALRAA